MSVRVVMSGPAIHMSTHRRAMGVWPAPHSPVFSPSVCVLVSVGKEFQVSKGNRLFGADQLAVGKLTLYTQRQPFLLRAPCQLSLTQVWRYNNTSGPSTHKHTHTHSVTSTHSHTLVVSLATLYFPPNPLHPTALTIHYVPTDCIASHHNSLHTC